MWKINRWEINTDGATATLNSNGVTKLTVPVTDEINWALKKQKEATVFLMAFNLVNNDDPNLIGYLNFILDDYINFLSSEEMNFLTTRMKEITSSNQIDINNTTTITNLLNKINSGNVDEFYDLLDKFQKDNASLLAKPINPESLAVKQH